MLLISFRVQLNICSKGEIFILVTQTAIVSHVIKKKTHEMVNI